MGQKSNACVQCAESEASVDIGWRVGNEQVMRGLRRGSGWGHWLGSELREGDMGQEPREGVACCSRHPPTAAAPCPEGETSLRRPCGRPFRSGSTLSENSLKVPARERSTRPPGPGWECGQGQAALVEGGSWGGKTPRGAGST